MDEMRQLVRILVKLMPHSAAYVMTADEGGGNRLAESEVKHYLACTLGDAPAPEWGLANGWGEYLAALFTWARGRPVSVAEAMRCARRLPGRPRSLRWRWPRRLRNIWLQNFGFLAVAIFSTVILTRPSVSAWVLR